MHAPRPSRAHFHGAFAAFTAIATAGLIAFSGASPAAAQEEMRLEGDPRPKTFVTDFTWYRSNRTAAGSVVTGSLACVRAAPRYARGEILPYDYSAPDGYYGNKYRRYERHGVDGVALVVTDRIPDSFAGSNAEGAARLAVEAGLEVMAYYDLFVTTALESGLVLCPTRRACGPGSIVDYDLRRDPEFRDQLYEDFLRIADHLIVPNTDNRPGFGYAMLEDAQGQRVLDEEGRPRPLVAIYIARELNDRPANQRALGELFDEIAEAYRARGLGRPALVLDVLFWGTRSESDTTKTYDPEIVDAFGDHAVAVTWYSFFDPYRAKKFKIANDGPRAPIPQWARRLRKHHRQVRRELEENGHALMVWPGATAQFDTRLRDDRQCRNSKPEIVFHARSAEDWRTMLQAGYATAARPVVGEGEVPLQTVVMINNAGEWFELGGIDETRPAKGGECGYPYHWCGELLEVLEEEDRY